MRFARLSFALAVAASTAGAQTVVTPSNMQGWTPNSITGAGTVAITGTQPRGLGTGSLELTGTGSADRTRYSLFNLNPGGFGLLNQLNLLSFDWFRSSTSTTSPWHVPVFRILVADPSSGSTTFRELVWEYEYQFGSGGNTAPTNAWTNDQNVLAGNLYIGGANGPGCNSMYDCLRANTNFGFGASTYVYGFSIGTGSGWSGSFQGFADDVRFRFGTQAVAAYDFELTAQSTVPEPSTYVLMAAGLAAIGLVVGRRRNA